MSQSTIMSVSVMSRRRHRFIGINSTFGSKVSAQGQGRYKVLATTTIAF